MAHPDNENSANLQKNVFGVGSLYGDGNYLKDVLLSKRRDTFKVHLVHECPQQHYSQLPKRGKAQISTN